MPELQNPKREAFARALAQGRSQTQAYRDAGYSGGKTAASRAATNVNVRARVAELQAAIAKKVVDTVSYQAVALFDRIRRVAEAALADGDYKTAADCEKFIAECFGYKDSPTLTHEHVKGQSLNPATEKPAATAPSNRFAHIFETIRKPAQAN